MNGYIYRAIATNRVESVQDTIDWYNQRADASENRIKELKRDFNAENLPYSDFKANAFYFGVSVLAYNLFAVMRTLAADLGMSRIKRVRYRVYQQVAKVVRTGRKLIIKMPAQGADLYRKLMAVFRAYRAPP